jgi:glutathione S-transferase
MMHSLPFELRLTLPKVSKPGGARSPEYLQINPWGNIPSIDDNGFILYEANAILCYLAEKFGWMDVYPSDISQRARIHQYLHWHHEHTRKLSLNLVAPILRRDPITSNDTHLVIEASDVVRDVNAYFGSNPFLCGNTMSIADIIAYCEVGQLQPTFFDLWDFNGYPNIQRWLQTMMKQPMHDEAHKGLVKFLLRFRTLRADRESNHSRRSPQESKL